MQASVELRQLVVGPRRLLVLAVVLLLAAAAAWSLQAAQARQPESRWPSDDGVFSLPGWSVSSATIERANGNVYVTRSYQNLRSQTPAISVALTTSTTAKSVYRAGADVPFLGSGFELEALPTGLVPSTPNWGVSLLRRGDERWLQISTYGERRGLLGNGVVGWSLAMLDTAIGNPADYYLLRATVGGGELNGAMTGQVVEIADALFPRIAGWYANQSG